MTLPEKILMLVILIMGLYPICARGEVPMLKMCLATVEQQSSVILEQKDLIVQAVKKDIAVNNKLTYCLMQSAYVFRGIEHCEMKLKELGDGCTSI